MTVNVRCTLDELEARVAADMAQLQRDLEDAVNHTAHEAAEIIKTRVPVAFGDLQGSVHGEHMKTVVDAPHAAAVEIGSRPHVPDMARLIAWVKLRGKQGINRHGRVRHPKQPTFKYGRGGGNTRNHALAVAHELKSMESSNGSLDIDAPERVAQRISQAIQKGGTKPHWYVRSSLPTIRVALKTEIRKALGK